MKSSDWFRRCWRSRGLDNFAYNFNIKSEFDLEIDLETEIPEMPSDSIEFSINRSRLDDDYYMCDLLYNAFKQFSKFDLFFSLSFSLCIVD